MGAISLESSDKCREKGAKRMRRVTSLDRKLIDSAVAQCVGL
jgi:hypothetical protein